VRVDGQRGGDVRAWWGPWYEFWVGVSCWSGQGSITRLDKSGSQQPRRTAGTRDTRKKQSRYSRRMELRRSCSKSAAVQKVLPDDSAGDGAGLKSEPGVAALFNEAMLRGGA